MSGPLDLFDVAGKVAIVTGASGSLGSAVSRGLADAGARVMLTGRSKDTLAPLADEITASGGVADFEVGAPDGHDAVTNVVAATTKRLGPVDVLVAAAGMNKPAPIVEQTVDEWEEIVSSQLKTAWLYCKEAGKVMIEHGGGKVILIGSQRGLLGMANYAAYSPAKAAVHLLTRTLAAEWGPSNIQVNCLAPGLFRSGLTEWMWEDDATYQRLLGRVPHGRLGEPEDFIGPVIFLSSKASDWMTGAILNVDGGYTAA